MQDPTRVSGHRLLLAAYPARLRRRHGAELVTTMVEMAPDGHPSFGDRVRVVLDGLRERFRLPARHRPLTPAAAVLVAVIGGAFGATMGSLAGEPTFAHPPGPHALAPLVLGPGVKYGGMHGDIYSVTSGHYAANLTNVQAAHQAADRFAAAGWTVDAITVFNDQPNPNSEAKFVARSGDIGVDVKIYGDTLQNQVMAVAWPKRAPTYWSLIAGGMLLGMVAGWLVAVALIHRIAGARFRLAGAVLAAAGVLLSAPAAFVAYRGLVEYVDFLRNPPGDGIGPLMHDVFIDGDPSTGALGSALGLGSSSYFPETLARAGMLAFALAVVVTWRRSTRTAPNTTVDVI